MADSRYGGLYQGKEKTIGAAVQKLLNDGRRDIQRQLVRWRENRAFYSGDVDPISKASVSLNTVREAKRASSNRATFDHCNRARSFIDGRLANYASTTPPSEIVPNSRDERDIEAARFGSRFINAHMGDPGWGVMRKAWDVAQSGEVQGVGAWAIEFNKNSGKPTTMFLDPQTKQPFVEPEALSAAQEQDPDGDELWTKVTAYPGEVEFRPIARLARLALDPFAVDSPDELRWIMESTIRSRTQIEYELPKGQTIKDLIEQSNLSTKKADLPPNGADAYVDDERGRQFKRDGEVVLHRLIALPSADFPKGAHIRWLNVAPNVPLLFEPWDNYDLPYFFFIPRKGPGHWLDSRGTLDDIKGLQLRLDRMMALSSESYLRLARPPVAMPVGTLRSDSIYNPEGFFEYHPAMGEPHEFNVSAEPAAMINQHFQFIIDQMGEISNLPPVARGISPGAGVESAVALQSLDQNKEQQMHGTAAAWIKFLERSMSFALELVCDNYTIPRLISAPGVDDPDEFEQFVGSMLRGNTCYQITGSVQPKTRAAQIQTAITLMPLLGPSIRPYLAKMIGDDGLDEFIQDDETQQNLQRDEITDLIRVGGLPQRDQLWQDFQQSVGMYQQALQSAMANPTMQPDPNAPPVPPEGPAEPPDTGSTVTKRVHPRPGGGTFEQTTTQPHPPPPPPPGPPQGNPMGQMVTRGPQVGYDGMNEQSSMMSQPPYGPMPQNPMVPVPPKVMLQQAGINPPKLIDFLRDAGITDLPIVEDFHDHDMHLSVLKTWRSKPANYKGLHPMVKQLLREHALDHQNMISGNLNAASLALGQGGPQGQGGSQPAPKGTPSPPSPSGVAGGQGGPTPPPSTMGAT